MANVKISFMEFTYQDLENGGEAHGRLFMNNNDKFEFEGDAEESAKVFFEYLKPLLEKYIKELDRTKYPLFFWKENTNA